MMIYMYVIDVEGKELSLKDRWLHQDSYSNFKLSTNIELIILNFSCPKCSGKGKIVKKKCHVCMGNKIVKGIEEMTIYVEKGMPDGYEIVK